MIDGRRMIAFDHGTTRFQFRAAAIIRREGYVLIHRATTEDSWALPGGRVEMGEVSTEALARELEEELGVAAEIGPLAIVMEDLFRYGGKVIHEMGFYYPVEIPLSFPFSTAAVCHTVADGGAMLEFRWVRNDAGTLAAMPLFPAELRGSMAELGPHPIHVVVNEL
jgi:8-oxo-dGTP pyrophosphatase MutT (NUDIX family)